MAEWRVACDGETLAWQRRAGVGPEAGEQRVAGADPQALASALRQAMNGRSRPGDTLRLALGSCYMRLAALPWPRDRLSAEEQRALLRQRWQERLDDADGWWLGVEGRGTVRLATAVRYELLDSLEDALASGGVRARACLPAAGLALHALNSGADACIALAEGPRQTLVTIAGGGLVNLHSAWRERSTLGSPADTLAAEPSRSTVDSADQLPDVRLDGGPRSWLEWF